MKHFMVDLESMGTDFESDDIIEIAILECIPTASGTYIPGKSYSRILHTSQKPKNDWIRNTHKDLLEKSRKVPMITSDKVRMEILGFFQSCGVNELAMLMGLNASTFDIPYLVQKGFLKKPQSSGMKITGDYHYRIYELRGAFSLAKDVLELNDQELFRQADQVTQDIQLPNGKSHQALYDCHKQLKTLNGVIRLLKRKASNANS